MEKWKCLHKIFNSSNYLISNLGNIICKYNKLPLRPDISSGYKRVSIINDYGVSNHYLIHMLVY